MYHMYCHSQLSVSNIIILIKLNMETSIGHPMMKIIPCRRGMETLLWEKLVIFHTNWYYNTGNNIKYFSYEKETSCHSLELHTLEIIYNLLQSQVIP